MNNQPIQTISTALDMYYNNIIMDENMIQFFVKYLATQYYTGASVITDREFDDLVSKYQEIYPDLDVWTATGWGYEPFEDNKFEHQYGPITGISSKVRNDEEFDKDMKAMPDDATQFIAMPKLDGGGIVLYYQNGHLEKALSRGDGKYGVDVTFTMSQLHSIPNTIPITRSVQIRGEVELPFENSMGIKTVRNSAVGFSQRMHQDLTQEEAEEVLFIPYGILSESTPSKLKELDLLLEWGFQPITYMMFNKADINSFEKYIEKSLDDIDMHDLGVVKKKIPIDGYIVEPNIPSVGDHETKKAFVRKIVAWKLDTDSVETTVLDIEWSMSDLGKMAPTLILDPIEIDDTNISRTTGNSVEWLKEYKCGVGAVVKIIKSGGVIPKLVETVIPSEVYRMPETCELCSDKLKVEGAHLFCVNPECQRQEMSLMNNVFAFNRPKYGADALLEHFLRIANIDSMKDMGDFKRKLEDESAYCAPEALEGYIASKLYKFVDGDMTDHQRTLLSKFWYSVLTRKMVIKDILEMANIAGLGDSASTKMDANVTEEDFLNIFNPMSDISHRSFDEPFAELLEGVSSNVVTATRKYGNNIVAMVEFWKSNIVNYGLTNHVVEVVKEEVVDETLKVVCLTSLTGSPLTKAKLKEKFKGKFTFTDDVNKDTDLVVFMKSGSSKHKKAIANGIDSQMVTEFILENEV